MSKIAAISAAVLATAAAGLLVLAGLTVDEAERNQARVDRPVRSLEPRTSR